MKPRTIWSDALLLLAALIWGVAFVPQRTAMQHLGPFTFTGVRFALGALALCPLLVWWTNGRPHRLAPQTPAGLNLWTGGALTGLFLCIAVNIQQVGMIYTTAGKAGFISGLYVVVVALLGLLWRHYPPLGTWLGALIAVVGLYLLAVPTNWGINRGDVLILASIIFWAVQILLISHMSSRVRVLPLAIVEFSTCAVLSLLVAAFRETVTLADLHAATGEILYTGLLSAGVAYTLQIAGQKGARPAHAAIIMSLETVFAALAGWLWLSEHIDGRGLAGCALMLAGMIVSQLAQSRAPAPVAPAPSALTP